MSLPSYIVLRNVSTWRDKVPLLTLDTNDHQVWNPDAQFYSLETAPENEIAKQFSYFAGYWLSRGKYPVDGEMSVLVYGSGGTFSFQVSSITNGYITGIKGQYSLLGTHKYNLVVQSDGVYAGKIFNPIAHYDASVTSSYTLTEGKVTQWNDLTGNEYHLINNGNGPTITAFGASNALNFDSNRGLISSRGVPLENSITIIMVIRYNSQVQAYGNYMHHGDRDQDWSLERSTDGSNQSILFQSSNAGAPLQGVTHNENYILVGRISGNNRDFWIYTLNGFGFSQTTGNNIGGAQSKTIYVGKSDISEPCNGIIAEIIYYLRAVDGSIIDNHITQLKNKWFQQAPTLGDFNDSRTFGTGSFNVTQPSSPSTGAFTYSVISGSDVISISGNTITILKVGSATVQASQAASASYLAATKTATISITPATPTLGDFNDSRTFGTGSFHVIQPSSPSTGPFSYSVISGTDVISISGTTITILKAGSAIVQASQTASTNYFAATKTATITINRATATLDVRKSIFYQKFVSGASVLFDVIYSNAGTVSRTHESNNTSIVSIPSSSSPSATIVGPGKTTINVNQPQQTNYEQVTANNLITIVIVGQGQTYTSENMTNTDFSNTNLSGSAFSSCNLTNVNLFGSTVNASTNFSTATLTNVRSGRIIGITTLLPSGFKMI